MEKLSSPLKIATTKINFHILKFIENEAPFKGVFFWAIFVWIQIDKTPTIRKLTIILLVFQV